MNPLGFLFVTLFSVFVNPRLRENGFWKQIADGFKSRKQLSKEFGIDWEKAEKFPDEKSIL